MADVLLTNSSDAKVVSIQTETAPIINPLGEQPKLAAVSSLDAASAAASQASDPLKNILGIDTQDPSVKNLIFLGLVAWAFWKWGRRL